MKSHVEAPEQQQTELIDYLNRWCGSEPAQIDLALDCIRHNIYGAACGGSIERRWLEAFPETELPPLQTAAPTGGTG